MGFNIDPAWERTEDLVYIVDADLNVSWVNDAWRTFAAENNGSRLLDHNGNINALSSFSGGHKARWKALYNSLLNGAMPRYIETFSCPSPTRRRTYELEVKPLYSDDENVVGLLHRTHLLSQRDASHDVASKPAGGETAEGPAKKAVRASAIRRPLEGLGGDLVTSIHPDQDTAWILIADGMGHDDSAAKAVSRLEALVREDLHGTPASVITRVNRLYCELAEQEDPDTPWVVFVTGILFLIDKKSSTMSICSFGHHGFLTSQKALLEIDGGMPLGVLKDAGPWPEDTYKLEDLGERSLAFTDGIVEQFNPSGEMYEMERVVAKFLQTLDFPLPDSLRKIIESVDEFRDGAVVKDDQTILGFEIEL